MRTHWRGLVVLAALVASVGAVWVVPSGASVPSRVGTAAVSFDQFACSLLSAADVGGAVGQTSAAGFPGTATPDPGAQASICNYSPQDGSEAFNVTVKVERYKSASAAQDAFTQATANLQPTQVPGFDQAATSAGSARLLHGSDVVWIDMFDNAGLPPTALTTLAAAAAQHYTAPSATQKPAVAGRGEFDPCVLRPKVLKAVFNVVVTSKPVVSDPGTFACQYTFAKRGKFVVTTTTDSALAKQQPEQTAAQWYRRQRDGMDPSAVDLTGFPGGEAAVSFNAFAVANESPSYALAVTDPDSDPSSIPNVNPDSFKSLADHIAQQTHTKVDKKTLESIEAALRGLQAQDRDNATAMAALAALLEGAYSGKGS